MTLYQGILMWVSLAAAFALAAAGGVVWCEAHEVLPGRRILKAFLRLPWLVRLFLVAFVVQLVVHGSTKTNQMNGVDGGMTNAPAMMMTGVPAPAVGTRPVRSCARGGCGHCSRVSDGGGLDERGVFVCDAV